MYIQNNEIQLTTLTIFSKYSRIFYFLISVLSKYSLTVIYDTPYIFLLILTRHPQKWASPALPLLVRYFWYLLITNLPRILSPSPSLFSYFLVKNYSSSSLTLFSCHTPLLKSILIAFTVCLIHAIFFFLDHQYLNNEEAKNTQYRQK